MWEVEVLDAVDKNFMSRREKGKEHIRTDLVMNKLHSTYTSIELFCLRSYIMVAKSTCA